MSWMRAVRRPLARWTGFDGNPLRRGTDRAEAWIRMVLLVAFLIWAPVLTVGVGQWAAARAAASARAHAAAIHPVHATVTGTAAGTAPGLARNRLGWVDARWRGPDGAARSGQIQAPPGARAGSTVTIWVDGSGNVSDPPLTHSQMLSRVITAAALTPVALALAVALVLGIAHRLFERRRLLAWESAWSAVEPHWTGRNRQ